MPQSPAPSCAMADDSQTSKTGEGGKRPLIDSGALESGYRQRHDD